MPSTNNPDHVWEQEETMRHLFCAWGYNEAILDAFLFRPGRSYCLRDKSGETAGIVGYVGEVEHQAYGATPVRVGYAAEIYLPPPALRQEKRLRTPRIWVA
jgi:hypothetical protein